jgi:hypothetical protein
LCEFDNPQFKLVQYEPAKVPLNVILLLKVNLAILKGHGLLVKTKKMYFAGIAFTMKKYSEDKILCGKNGIQN